MKNKKISFAERLKNVSSAIPLVRNNKQSLGWFYSKVNDLTNDQLRGVRRKTKISMGEMYFFIYDPKHKATLPYYDRFPLIFPLNMYDNGFLGLNFHYLPYKLRIQLLDSLDRTREKSKLSIFGDKEYANISYSLLLRLRSHDLYRHAIKRYLSGHVRSPFAMVQSEDWDKALFLPVEDFVKASKRDVWADAEKFASRRRSARNG